MAKWKKAAHVVYQCSYPLVWTPKYKYRILQGEIAEYVEKKLRAICEWKRVEILEIAIKPDHVHMVAIIPPKQAVAEINGDTERENGDRRFPTPKKPPDKAVLGQPLLELRLLCYDGWDR